MMTSNRVRVAAALGALGLWQVISLLQIWPDYLFPAPADVGRYLWHGVISGELLTGLVWTLCRILTGFTFSAIVGIGLGLLITRQHLVEAAVGPVVTGLQALPSICWFPIAILWLGPNERAILFVTVAGALFAVTAATMGGVRNIPPLYLRAARTMGARGRKLYTRVILPAALPFLLSGLRQGWAFAWRSLMAAELLFLNKGLGAQLMIGRELNDVAQIFGVILTILLIGWLVDRLLFARVEEGVRRRWGLAA